MPPEHWRIDFHSGRKPHGTSQNVRDAVACHFDQGQGPSILRLHFVKEEILAL
jgi:hypothetical protein